MILLKELDIELKNQYLIFTKKSELDESLFTKIAANHTILFQGGGNFGDLYRRHNDFRKSLIKHFLHQKIIFFPQTINYRNKALAKLDNELFSNASDLSLFVRSLDSYEFAKSFFPTTKSFLVPDAAFMIGDIKPSKKPDFDIFVLRRTDNESRFNTTIWKEILKKKLGNKYSFLVSSLYFI